MDIEYLISNIGLIVEYLVSGFIFIKAFLFARNSVDDSSHNSHYILPSIVISYCFKEILELLFGYSGVDHLINLMLLLSSAAIGLAFGRLSKSNVVQKICINLFHKQANTTFWEGEFKQDYIYHIKYYHSDFEYVGGANTIDVSAEEPFISLYGYYIYDVQNDTIVEDRTKNSDYEILLHIKNVEYIKLEPHQSHNR